MKLLFRKMGAGLINSQRKGRYIIVAWCRFFIPKIASPAIKPGDPDLNDHIMYAKCIKGHVLKDANDWILCENLPAPDAQCWMEGGDTIFSLAAREQEESKDGKATKARKPATSPRSGQ
jgi:hypothetical protein